MPAKILLADKSITIQKVVEMLFSGKEYEVVCVSDGEAALAEASRIIPDVVLADIDLPRVDGYSFSARMKQVPALSRTPVILMMSRDDVFDDAKARQAFIADHIAKPFESQELISKVKKAVADAGRRQAPEPSLDQEPAAAATKHPASSAVPPVMPHPASPVVRPRPAAPKPKQPAADIFDIIQEAPSEADLKKTVVAASDEDAIYEVEPVVEVEEPIAADMAGALPEGDKAVEEMRAGLGLAAKTAPADEEIVSFEEFDVPAPKANVPPPRKEPLRSEQKTFEPREYVPPPPEPPVPALQEDKLQSIAESIIARIAREHFSKIQPPKISEEKLNGMAEEIISGMAREYFKKMPPVKPPVLSEATVQNAVDQIASRMVMEIARDVIEKVAWEVIPDLAATMIRSEIERLKAKKP